MTPDYAEIFDLTDAAYAIVDADHRLVRVNDAYCSLVRQPADRLIGANIFDLFSGTADREERVRTAFTTALNGERAVIRELHYPIPDPDLPDGPLLDKWWTLSCTPLRAAAPCFLVQATDVTEDVGARNLNEVYAAELQHRIGNLLNIVQILARKTALSSTDLDGFLPAFDARITALGKTHAFLSGKNWDGMTLRNILEQQLSGNLIQRPAAIALSGPDWHLSVLHAQAFSMAVHELMINSVSYGALGAPDGHVDIAWAAVDGGRHRFSWHENGLQDVQAPARTGFGMLMLSQLLPGQLGGRADCVYHPDGFRYDLYVPEGPEVKRETMR